MYLIDYSVETIGDGFLSASAVAKNIRAKNYFRKPHNIHTIKRGA